MTGLRKGRKAGMAFIPVTVVIDVLGIGIIIPILPELAKDFVGGSTADAGGSSWAQLSGQSPHRACCYCFAVCLGIATRR